MTMYIFSPNKIIALNIIENNSSILSSTVHKTVNLVIFIIAFQT